MTKTMFWRGFEKGLVATLAVSVLLGGSITAQKGGSDKSGTAAKMRSVPRLGRDRGEVKAGLSAPKNGVIIGAEVREDSDGEVMELTGSVPVQGATDAKDAAEKFLLANAKKLGISGLVGVKGGSSGLRVVHQVESPLGTHLTYQQFYNNLPVFDEQLKISVDKKFKVTDVVHDVEPIGDSRATLPTEQNKEAAIQAALKAIQGKPTADRPAKAEMGIVMSKTEGATGVFKVTVVTRSPLADWRVMVDAETLEVISVKNVARYATAPAKIMNPNPVNSSGLAALAFDGSQNTLISAQMQAVTLRDLDASGTLSGIYATTAPTTAFRRAKKTAAGFMYKVGDPRVEEVMTYHWVTEATHRIHDLGFTGIMNKAIPIDVNGSDDDNSSFTPSTGELLFGSGGVPDAQDAMIILHEFGHAVLNAQVPDFGGSDDEAGAISEAFGDYFAASFFAGKGKNGHKWDAYVGTWDAVAYNPGTPAFLRRVDGQKMYPRDLDDDMEVHNNGEIWSSLLWEVRALFLNPTDADKLIITAHFKLGPSATFKQNAEALLTTDGVLNGGKNQAKIRQIFVKRGVLKK